MPKSMSEIIIGKCTICSKEKELHKTSHIYPKFMYRGAFGKKSDLSTFSLTSTGTTEPDVESDSPHEIHKYCVDCEKYFGMLESYSARILNEKLKSHVAISSKVEDGHETFYYDVKYDKFKKFILSLILRASITEHPFFDTLKIADHEKQLKEIVLSTESYDRYFYPIVVNRHAPNSKFNFFAQPFLHEFEGERLVFMFLGKYMVWVLLSTEKNVPAMLMEGFILKEDGYLPVPNSDDNFIQNIVDQSRLSY